MVGCFEEMAICRGYINELCIDGDRDQTFQIRSRFGDLKLEDVARISQT